MASLCHSNPALVNDVAALDTPNAIREWGDDKYIYVKLAGADAGVVGKYALRHTDEPTTEGSVTMTAASAIPEALGSVADPVGVFVKAITAGYFGYLLREGRGTVFTDDGVAEGDFLVCDGGTTPTFIADTAVAGEEHAICGRALADDSDVTHLVTAEVYCRG